MDVADTCEAVIQTETPSIDALDALVFSIYMGNVPQDVVDAQAEVIRAFLPDACDFVQILDSDHPAGIDRVLAQHNRQVYLILDVDCIPLAQWVMPWMLRNAAAGVLVGCAQRASHLENQGHIYAGPFAMAFSRDLYQKLDRISFASTPRGDVGEELTYRCEELGMPMTILWPTDVVTPKWDLRGEHRFGNGTTYGDAIYHAFEIRFDESRPLFLAKCRDVLQGK